MSSEINPSNIEVVETVHDPHQTLDTTHIREQISGIKKEMVNLNLGSSSHTDELKELGSDQVWEHFESLQGEDGTEWAVCNYCRKKLVGSINIGTKHLQNHFERCAEKRNIDQIIQLYEEEKERLGTYLKNLSCRLCLSICEYRKYILFRIHFIDGDWYLNEKVIGITKIEEDSNIWRCLEDVLWEWRIDENISSIIDSCTRKMDVVKYAMSYIETKGWFTGRVSFPFAGKLLYTYSLQNLASEYFELLRNLVHHVIDKIYQVFEYIQKGSSKEQNFQIAIERAKSLGKDVTAAVIDEEVYDHSDKEFLEIAVGYKEAFFELEHMDTEFERINLTKEEWDQALALKNSLDELYHNFAYCSWGFEPGTANKGFILLCELYTKSLLLSKIPLFFGDSEEIFNCFINIMFENWSKKNLVVAVATVLDPRFKLDIVQYWYKKIYGSEWETQFTLFKDYFTDVYDGYARLDFLGRQQPYDSPISHEMLDPSGRPCELEDVSLRKSELDLYLKEVKFPSFEKFDVLKWWHVSEQYFPTLARMARDFLPINLGADFPHNHRARDYILENEQDYPHSGIPKEVFLFHCWNVIE